VIATDTRQIRSALPPVAAAVALAWLVAAVAAARADGYDQAPGWLLLVNLAVLLPAAVASAWWVGSSLNGPLLGAWFALAIVLVPPLGVLYALAAYRGTYVDRVLPEAVGIADSGSFAAGALLVVSSALLLAALARRAVPPAAAAGLLAGVAALAEPSAVLFLLGPALACALALAWREAAGFAAGAAAPLVALAVWRGAGWIEVSWSAFDANMAGLREYMWSNRLLQWLPIAGAIGVARRSLPAAGLLAGWFGAFALSEGASADLAVADGSFLVAFVPALPAFSLLVAAVPLLVPTLPDRLDRREVTTS
jgi:hypothetical protein